MTDHIGALDARLQTSVEYWWDRGTHHIECSSSDVIGKGSTQAAAVKDFLRRLGLNG